MFVDSRKRVSIECCISTFSFLHILSNIKHQKKLIGTNSNIIASETEIKKVFIALTTETKRSYHTHTESKNALPKGCMHQTKGTKGKYHCTVDLLFDWFGSVSFANKNKKF
jgi:hypothetical protein